MDSQNLELARTVMDAFNRRDVETFGRHVTEDFEWITPDASTAAARIYRGRSGIREFFEHVSNWRTVEARVDEWHDLGDDVLLLGEVLWRGHNPRLLEVSCPLRSLWSFDEGRLRRIDSANAPSVAPVPSSG